MALRQVTVFGGSGFLGRYVVQHLARSTNHRRLSCEAPRCALYPLLSPVLRASLAMRP